MFYYYIIIVLLFVFLLLAIQYKKCPKNHILVIYNRLASNSIVKILSEKERAFVCPIIQGCIKFSAEPIVLDVDITGNILRNKARVNLNFIYTIKVSDTKDILQNAIYNLVSLNTLQVIDKARELITEQLYKEIPHLSLRDIGDERLLADRLNPGISKELKKIGIELKNVVIGQIKNEN